MTDDSQKIRKLVVLLMNSPTVDDEDHEYDDGINAGVQAVEALLLEARYKGIEEVLLRLKQAPPIDWLDAQTWIDGEYNRLQKKLKDIRATLKEGK